MTSWIFQANPDRFDLDRFLASGVDEMRFTVSRQGHEMRPDDQVFIWRAQGRAGAVAGVVAEATMLEEPHEQPDDEEAAAFWSNPGEASEPHNRVRLKIGRVAHSRQVVRRDWLTGDPVLADLTILRMPSQTNYKLSGDHATRLNSLWVATGVDWSRAESLAALLTYARTIGQPISRLPDSPVADTATLIGRAVSGVYNKLMNFRSIDPNDERAGLPGASGVDRAVWAEFYNPEDRVLEVEALEQEYLRLWGNGLDGALARTAEQERGKSEEDVDQLADRPLEELLALLNRRRSSSRDRRAPIARATSTRVYARDALISAYAKRRAEFRCEVPDCGHPAFLNTKGKPYCEVHHIHPLADGGLDILENVVCLCPAHHVEAHLGSERAILRATFETIRRS